VIYTDRFAAYKTAVVSAYLQKRAEPQEEWLIKATRGRIRQLCLKLIENGLEKRDEKMLREYLEMEFSEHDFLAAIKKTDADDFQGLFQFLNKTEINPAEINVEVLAWLIGFPARPFSQYIKEPQNDPGLIKQEEAEVMPIYQGDTKDPDTTGQGQQTTALKKEDVANLTIRENITSGPAPEGKGKEEPPISQGKNIDRRWFIGIAVLLVGGLFIWLFLPKDYKCMYWNNDHYVATACDVPRLDTPLVRLDPAKLRGFRRIHQVDTLTHYSAGKLWYVRVGGIIEVYSADGKHPLYPDKELKILTDYAINVSKKQHE
jgi:hypothetical protein